MSRLRTLLTRAGDGPVAASLFVLLLAGLLVVEFARPRQGSPVPARDGGSPGSASAAGQSKFVNVPIPLRPIRGATLDRPLAAGEQLVVDRSGRGDTALLGAQIEGRRVTLTQLTAGEGSALAGPVELSARDAPSSIQVDTRGGLKVIFVLSLRGDRVMVESHDSARGRLLVRASSGAVPRPKGSTRDVRIALWSGSEPDLFVLDRGGSDGTMEVRVLSGESGYRTELLAARVPVAAGFPAGSWDLDVGDVQGRRPDIMLVTTSPRTPSGGTEVHIASGDSAYRSFIVQVRSALPAGGPDRSAVLGVEGGSPAWFSVVDGTRELLPFRLRARSRSG